MQISHSQGKKRKGKARVERIQARDETIPENIPVIISIIRGDLRRVLISRCWFNSIKYRVRKESFSVFMAEFLIMEF
jgi:hypothetical protein